MGSVVIARGGAVGSDHGHSGGGLEDIVVRLEIVVPADLEAYRRWCADGAPRSNVYRIVEQLDVLGVTPASDGALDRPARVAADVVVAHVVVDGEVRRYLAAVRTELDGRPIVVVRKVVSDLAILRILVEVDGAAVPGGM